MEETSQHARIFVDAMMRLKRDTVNFQTLGISENLSFQMTNTIVTFDTKYNVWNLKSEWILNPKWNPTIDEIMVFIKHFTIDDFNNGVLKLKNQTKIGYSSINGLKLSSKFEQVLHLLKLEENQTSPLIQINIELLNKHIYTIFYNSNLSIFLFSDTFTGDKPSILLKTDFLYILENSTYYNIFEALNIVYKLLIRKK